MIYGEKLKVKKILKWLLYNFPTMIAGAAGILSLLLITVNVFGRYVLNYSIPGIDELVVICFSYLIFIGAASAYRAKMHYGIDVFINLLPERLQRVVEIITHIIIIVLAVSVVYLGISFANAAWKRTTIYWHIPYFFVDIPIAVGFLFILVYAGVDLYKLLFRPDEAKKERENRQITTIS